MPRVSWYIPPSQVTVGRYSLSMVQWLVQFPLRPKWVFDQAHWLWMDSVDREAFRRVSTCKPGKPGLTSFSETLALFFIQFLSFWKMKVQDRQNGPSGLPEKTGWLRAWLYNSIAIKCDIRHIWYFTWWHGG